MVRIVHVEVELHWGYSIKEPLYTASQPTYKLPPQTTVVGALAYPYAYINRLPENIVDGDKLYSTTVRLASMIRWVSIRNTMAPLGPIETMDINRLILVLGIRRAHIYPGSRFLWGVQPIGKIYSPSWKLEIMILPEKERVNGIARLAYSIVRLGCRESLVSVDRVEVVDANVSRQEFVSTSYYFPRRLAREISGNYMVTHMPTLTSEFYRLAHITDPRRFIEEYIIPRDPVGRIDVRLAEDAIAILNPVNNDHVIIPKEVLR